MIKNIKMRVTPDIWADPEKLEAYISRSNAISRKALKGIRIMRRSIDARQRQVMIQLEVDCYINEEPPQELFTAKIFRELPSDAPQAVVVGLGPAGLFASLRLIELGIRPIVLERGRNVVDRRRDVAAITRDQRVNPESNFCFGEGGAGAFSDGKLFTRSRKRGNVTGVLECLCQFGADTGILDASHPHIGTDCLPRIISNMREKIIECGGQVYFETCMSELILSNGFVNLHGEGRVVGVRTKDGREFLGPVILATGHSARDVYRMLHAESIPIEAKGLAIGARLEHPQQLIDQIQYHSKEGRGAYLPAAEYAFVCQQDNRGVYSFCMCPGGVVVPSATGEEQVVVNGMSASARGSRWANSAMVCEIRVEDIPALSQQLNLNCKEDDPLAMIAIQEEIERLAWLNAGKTQVAPAQRMVDFVKGRLSADLPQVSYTPGVVASPIHFWMPQFIAARMRQGLDQFGRTSRGFLTNEAVLIAPETRTSSPVRIPRDRELFVHPTISGLYPCGEGAGFAGGIVSAAMDGERCADALAASLGKSCP